MAFDPVWHPGASERPLLDIFVPSVARPETAPDGADVVSLLVHFRAPSTSKAVWTKPASERLGDAAVAELGARRTRCVRSAIVRAPGAHARGLGRSASASKAGTFTISAARARPALVIRPTLDTMRYATPVRGLFLCGSG